MSVIEIIDIVWKLVVIFGVAVATAFVGMVTLCVHQILEQLKNIDGALRCIDIDLAAIHGDLKKPENRR